MLKLASKWCLNIWILQISGWTALLLSYLASPLSFGSPPCNVVQVLSQYFYHVLHSFDELNDLTWIQFSIFSGSTPPSVSMRFGRSRSGFGRATLTSSKTGKPTSAKKRRVHFATNRQKLLESDLSHTPDSTSVIIVSGVPSTNQSSAFTILNFLSFYCLGCVQIKLIQSLSEMLEDDYV